MIDEYERLKKILQEANRVMGPWERRAQGISFAYGNLALMSKYTEGTEDDLWRLRLMCAKAYDKRHLPELVSTIETQ